jgi:hypothetical protein
VTVLDASCTYGFRTGGPDRIRHAEDGAIR